MMTCVCFFVLFFFFKQKTAYEMRISDWSSDVCSSDLMPADVKVTERYVAALQYGLARIRQEGRRALDLRLIHELHAQLMQDEVGRFPVGAYRTDQVWIGASHRIEDATFVPAPPARIQGCMDEMAASILQYAPRSDEQGELSLVAQLAIAHPQFETIHPYHDGNGRTETGRAHVRTTFTNANHQ